MKPYFKAYILMHIVLQLLISCKENEIRYEYYDINNSKLKSKAEFIDGKLNGRLALYDEDGNALEVSQWKNGIREGETIKFHPNGKIGAFYNYENGKAIGRYEIYYENGKVKTEGIVESDGFVSNAKDYDINGLISEMKPFVAINKDTILVNDTLIVRGSIENIHDKRYSEGTMILRKKSSQESESISTDTLSIVTSKFNDYTIKYNPKHRGFFSFTLLFYFQLENKTNNGLDSLDYFSTNELQVFIK